MLEWLIGTAGLLSAVAFVAFGLKMIGAAAGLLVLGSIVGALMFWSFEGGE